MKNTCVIYLRVRQIHRNYQGFFFFFIKFSQLRDKKIQKVWVLAHTTIFTLDITVFYYFILC